MHFNPITWPSEMKQEKTTRNLCIFCQWGNISLNLVTLMEHPSTAHQIAMTNISLAIWTKSST
jgi:hypothetical protein